MKPAPARPAAVSSCESHLRAAPAVKKAPGPHPIPSPRGRLKRGVAAGDPLVPPAKVESRASGQAGDPARDRSGTENPCPAPWWHLAHLILSQTVSSLISRSAKDGNLEKSYGPEVGGARDESLAIEKKVTERRVAKTRPACRLHLARMQSCSSTASVRGGARVGTCLSVCCSDLQNKETCLASKADASKPRSR